ncbi:hypothetical protein PHLGIDRAFT_113828 [Phlebiopsis gigantea 11061_1 CR5-6]|uniref:Protein kinase domain-containing protein n=1 Tax=Phlebiopsis gigantea (strain 11061_1 CR5-6) TaxID=745531 RepID=A0A0C3PWI6_PHLG1|nr:hypothetical protein PHLGIDRAFT_113828 [Phlebiopsis gigantea 11061_1 CR5-6]
MAETPLPSPSFLSPMKPSKARTAATQSSLAQERENLLLDLDETVPEIDRSFFETHLLPPSPLPPGATVKSIVSNLISSGHVKEGARWKGWNLPSDSPSHEDVVFRKFESLAEAILAAYQPLDRGKTTRFLCNPNAIPESTSRVSTSKPDAYALRSRTAHDATPVDSLRWVDVAVPGEFKKTNKPAAENDNRVKILWSMNHMMREDARRRFVIGFTIDNADMRYWFCSRSDVFMSTSFNWLTDHDVLVDFIFRIVYATEKQLGWDQSIKLVRLGLNDNKPQYDITVTDDETMTTKTFRTKRMISNIGADSLRGRGTRVWEVVEVDAGGHEKDGKSCVLKDCWIKKILVWEVMELDAEGHEKGGETCVLKDCWVDDDRDREGKIMAQIRADAKAAQARADKVYEETKGKKPDRSAVYQTINDSLLTVVVYGDVRAGQQADKTRNWSMPELVGLNKVYADSRAKVIVQTSLAPSGAVTVETGTESSKLIYVPFSTKIHHRLVLKEVGTPIRAVELLSKSFLYIREVLLALRELHSIGWVHRDISSGNILVVNGHAKIADFEYAKHENDFTMHGVRTGTPYFMATEVDNNSYLHCLEPSSADPVDIAPVSNSEWLDELEEDRQMMANAALGEANVDHGLPGELVANQPAAMAPFRHNPLHDMESLVWLSLYLLLVGILVHAGDATPEELSEFTDKHRALARDLFTQKVTRRDVMNDMKRLGALITAASLHPQAELVGAQLAMMTKSLIAAYIAAERTLDEPIKFTVAKDNKLYENFRVHLREILRILVPNDLTVTVDAKSCELLQQALATAKADPQRTSSGTATRSLAEPDAGEDEIGAPAPKKFKA